MAEPLITEQVAEILGPVETYVRTGQEWIVLGVGVGLTVGFGAGYLFAKRRLETKYDKLAQTEIDEAREYYRAAKAATEARLKEPIEEVVEYLGYIKKEDAEVPVAPSLKEDVVDLKAAVREAVEEAVVFPDNSSDWVWDQALEEKMRDDNKGFPYVICLDEWGEKNHEGYEQSCWTWYYEDEVLADERDEVVDNADELIGLNNLNRFGHGTDSRDIVLIRNEALSMEYEISRSHGKYSEEVHGFLRHNYAVERMPKRRQGFDDEQSDQ
jgi:hypothetical protein